MKQWYIQTKDVNLLYQVQVISDEVYIGVSPVKSWKWPIQLALTKIYICAKSPKFFVCSHLKTLKGFLSKAIKLSFEIKMWEMCVLVSKKKKTIKAKLSSQKHIKCDFFYYSSKYILLLFTIVKWPLLPSTKKTLASVIRVESSFHNDMLVKVDLGSSY